MKDKDVLELYLKRKRHVRLKTRDMLFEDVNISQKKRELADRSRTPEIIEADMVDIAYDFTGKLAVKVDCWGLQPITGEPDEFVGWVPAATIIG